MPPTDKQGKSGLGLQAQRKAVLDYLNGGSWSLAQEFVEIESGKHNERPQLSAALAACKKNKAKLAIAKLDRLSRSSSRSITRTPTSSPSTFSRLWRRQPLGRPWWRGTRLGNPDLARAAKRGVAAVKANARRFAANVRPIIDEIIAAGATSHNAIAAKLNERNVRTARGGAWTHVQVGAILHPFGGASVVAV